MKKRILTIVTILSLILLGGCYPEGAEYIEDMDIVITNFNDDYDFSSKQTYAMPDSIVKITGNQVEGDDPVFIPQETASQILARIEDNMAALGWQKVAVDAMPEPDLLLLPASWEATTIYIWYDYWYWWWGGYYPGWGYPYYYSYSYSTGTLLMTLIDPDELAANGAPIVQWTGASSGILTSKYSSTRVNKAIDKAFNQSPYLLTNQ